MLDQYDEETRQAAIDFMKQDTKTLENARKRRELSMENLANAKIANDDDRVQRIEDGLARADQVIEELETKLDGGLEVITEAPPCWSRGLILLTMLVS